MITVRDILVERARRQGLIRQADLHRLAKQVPTHRLTLPRCLRRLLIRFGELLITMVQQLQAREAAQCTLNSSTGQNAQGMRMVNNRPASRRRGDDFDAQ